MIGTDTASRPSREERLENMPDVCDWDSDHSGVKSATLRFETDPTLVRVEDADNMEVHIHVHQGNVRLVFIRRGDRNEKPPEIEMTIVLEPAEAELIGQQLFTAAREWGYEGGSADVRT